jgi:hypothetical protein
VVERQWIVIIKIVEANKEGHLQVTVVQVDPLRERPVMESAGRTKHGHSPLAYRPGQRYASGFAGYHRF